MSTSTRNLLLTVFLLVFAAAPALAQHGGGGDDHMGGHGHMDGDMPGHMNGQAGMGMMEGMHSGEMMDQMNRMMEQMSEMMQEMQGHHEQMPGRVSDKMMSRGQEMPMGMMPELSSDLEALFPVLESMLQHMHRYQAGNGPADDSPMADQMHSLMTDLDAMIRSGHAMMSSLHTMNRGAGESAPGGHQH